MKKDQEQFIFDNYKKMTQKEMAFEMSKNSFMSLEKLRKYMKERGLKSLHMQRIENNHLTDEQINFIHDNCIHLTPNEIRKELRLDYKFVYNYMNKHGLLDKRKDLYKGFANDKEKVPLIRPAEQYSNPQYHLMYL
jgi:hypothetical protein